MTRSCFVFLPLMNKHFVTFYFISASQRDVYPNGEFRQLLKIMKYKVVKVLLLSSLFLKKKNLVHFTVITDYPSYILADWRQWAGKGKLCWSWLCHWLTIGHWSSHLSSFYSIMRCFASIFHLYWCKNLGEGLSSIL